MVLSCFTCNTAQHQQRPLQPLMLLLLAALLSNIHCYRAAVLAPNINACNAPLNLPSAEKVFHCCAPVPSYEPQLFRPSAGSAGAAVRIRRPSHLVTEDYAAKLARAYSLMKELPAEDPRSFTQQANVHCAYCNAVYNQSGSSQRFQAHLSWLFFPFHRWYLYFHERILAKLLGDDTFALSFWNYDHHNGTSIPWFYSSTSYPYSILSNANRDAPHVLPNATAAVDLVVAPYERPRDAQLKENDNTMYRVMIRDAQTPEEFFGWPVRQGEDAKTYSGAGTVELNPHNNIHRWVGNKSSVGWKDMGTFYTAANDPLFYAHHAELDRLWEIWKTIPEHLEYEDEDYLNAEFLFYNEDAEMVRVKAGDASNTTLLGYVYEDVAMPWMEATPERRSSGPATLTDANKMCEVGEWFVETPCSIVVDRDPTVTKNSPWLHEHLVLTMQYDTSDLELLLYLNYPSANVTTDTGCEEYLFSMTLTRYVLMYQDMVAEAFAGNKTQRIDMSRRLHAVGLMEETSVVITLVPRVSPSPSPAGRVAFISASMEYTVPYQRSDTSSPSSVI
ncbi:hypothetical protein KP509_03G057900 [Ceratopteris richardii]|uniref:Tyrosinase copper-binding domain-containing protein n=1 Tax=Ceratopteris richardii TaxID=49495 RepID=A0A8T2V804_CERRI|nr:hypothetical protein KP509_03G057900 [Ceratopteris richardii]